MQERIREGRPTRFYDTRPPFPADLEFYRTAFLDLSSDRETGMGIGRIPWRAINEYAQRHEVRDFELFHALIRATDDAWLQAIREKRERETEEPQGNDG
jgi:hypothetical protein